MGGPVADSSLLRKHWSDYPVVKAARARKSPLRRAVLRLTPLQMLPTEASYAPRPVIAVHLARTPTPSAVVRGGPPGCRAGLLPRGAFGSTFDEITSAPDNPTELADCQTRQSPTMRLWRRLALLAFILPLADTLASSCLAIRARSLSTPAHACRCCARSQHPAEQPRPRERKRDRLLRWLRLRPASETSAAPAPVRSPEDNLPLSMVAAAEKAVLSTLVFDAIASLQRLQNSALNGTEPLDFAGKIATRVGNMGDWYVFGGANGALILVERLARSADPISAGCDASVEYSSERVFEALMDETMSSTAAVALGRLRVRGSLSIATASEELFVRADAMLRARFPGPAAESYESMKQAANTARLEAAAREEEERRARIGARSPLQRALYRHAGTDQQAAAILLVVGSVLYAGYCDASHLCSTHPGTWCEAAPAQAAEACILYLTSALLWLAGSFALVHASYPERVLCLAATAADDAADGGARIRALPWVKQVMTASSALVGAWGLGVGAPTFLLGALAQLRWLGETGQSGGAQDVVAWIYVGAGVYIIGATAVMVAGLQPASLACNDGQGSRRVRDMCNAWAVERMGLEEMPGLLQRVVQRYAATDVEAGACWGSRREFASGMLALCR